MIFSKLLLINTLQRLEAQTLGHYWDNVSLRERSDPRFSYSFREFRPVPWQIPRRIIARSKG